MTACGLCKHDPACGHASVQAGTDKVHLCHTDDHSCYEQWTVHGRHRPQPYSFAVLTTGAKSGKGVLVTDHWDQAAADIRSKIEAGAGVRVMRVDPGVSLDSPQSEHPPEEVANAWNIVHMSLSASRGKPQQHMAEHGICVLARLLQTEVV